MSDILPMVSTLSSLCLVVCSYSNLVVHTDRLPNLASAWVKPSDQVRDCRNSDELMEKALSVLRKARVEEKR